MDGNKWKPKETDLGNTDNRSVPRVYWSFTYNNYNLETLDSFATALRHFCDWYVFQEETGENETKHLQGTLKCKKKTRMTELKYLDKSIHWEPTKSVLASVAYCTKQASRTGKQWIYNIDIPKTVQTIQTLYPWQQAVIDIISQPPDDRSVYWYFERSGNTGKTALCKYLVVHHDALVLSGKMNDMFHIVAKRVAANNPPTLIVIDCPRSMTEYINYGGIEKLKDGLFCSGKYDGNMVVYNSPHLLVFSNEHPDMSKLSLDRWHIIELD